MIIRHPLRRHVKNRAPKCLSTRIDETVSTDPMFANVPSIFHGFLGLQAFFCGESKCIMIEGFKNKGEFPNLHMDFMRKHGTPSILRRDNSKEQCSWIPLGGRRREAPGMEVGMSLRSATQVQGIAWWLPSPTALWGWPRAWNVGGGSAEKVLACQEGQERNQDFPGKNWPSQCRGLFVEGIASGMTLK